MADPTQIPPLNPLVKKEDLDALRDYISLQADVEKSIKTQNNSLLQQFGIRKDLSLSIRQYLINTKKLNDIIDDARDKEKQIQRSLISIKDETKRREVENILAGVKLRREAAQEELLGLQKVRAMGLLPIIWAVSKVYSLFKDLDKSAWEFRKAMGMTRDSAESFRKTIQNIAIDYMHIGVTADGATASMISLGKEMGSIRAVTKDLVKSTAILKAQLGVAEDDTAGFLKNMASISKSTMQTQENMAYIVADLSMAAGVPLPVIMKDLATKSGTTLTMMSRLPNQVARAAVELRKMGTSLDQAAKSSREILNFSDNINAEMETSVLLGRSINLQRARELAYRRDLEGSTREILKLTNEIDFANLDVFQQEAFARATGKSVDELLKLAQAEQQWKKARTTPELIGQVEAYEQLRAANQATAKASAENLKLIIQQKSNQERLTAITQKWNQVVAQLASIFLPIVDRILSLGPSIIGAVDIISKLSLNLYSVFLIAEKMDGIFEKISLSIKSIGPITRRISSAFGYMSIFSEKIAKAFVTVGTAITSLFARLGKTINPIIEFLRVFGKVGESFKWIVPLFKSLGKFTLVLNVAFAVWNVIKSIISGIKEISNGNWAVGLRKIFLGSLAGIVEGFFGFIVDIPILILRGLGHLGVDTAKIWADTAEKWWNELKDWFGFSPSKIGLSIVKGISSVGPMLFDALTAPFRNGLSWIMDKLPGMGKVAEKLRSGMGGLINKPLEAKLSGESPSVITPVGMKVAGEVASQTAIATAENKEKATAASDVLLGNILDAINTLNKNLESGKIGFYIDGQLMSATLARQTDFRRGYGVNKI